LARQLQLPRQGGLTARSGIRIDAAPKNRLFRRHCLPGTASAGMIDFTRHLWAGANGNAQATWSSDANVPGSVCGALLACNYDGIGLAGLAFRRRAAAA
jgi:hypothetical protein